jgi:hypothetical protein
MMRGLLISLGVAFLATLIVYAAIFILAPTMYVEKAFNILSATFFGSAIGTLLIRMRRRG